LLGKSKLILLYKDNKSTALQFRYYHAL